MSIPHFARVVRKLESHSRLEKADLEALAGIPFTLRSLDPNAYIVRDGDCPESCSIILAGFAYRHKVTGDGERQILSIHLPGDFIDLQNVFLDQSDHNVQALTRAEIALVPRAAIRKLADDFPNIGRAMWTDTLIDGSIFREWVMNVGRRDSLTRIAHLLCEFAIRLESGGLGSAYAYDLPMTQEQLADAVGLTPVHVNRVLKELGARGLIVRQKRAISIPDWEKLAAIGDFTTRYLHLRQADRDTRPGGFEGGDVTALPRRSPETPSVAAQR